MNNQACYRLAPGVSIRPERFGGLVYRYDNRRLFFLHSHELVEFVIKLDGEVPLDDALNDYLSSSQLAQSARPTFTKALAQLEKLGALVNVNMHANSEAERQL
jgi:putative mycofactocin binding protein MftB